MSPDVVRWIIALVLFAHGVGHVLFLPALAPVLRLDASGTSWLLDPIVGIGATRLVATLVAVVALLAFVLAAGGVLLQSPWWRSVAVGGAVASACLILAMWGGLQTSGAFSALAFDVVVLVALLVARWPSEAFVV